jgi:hypothetical protein
MPFLARAHPRGFDLLPQVSSRSTSASTLPRLRPVFLAAKRHFRWPQKSL